VRPDGYVAFAQQQRDDIASLARYLDDWKIAARR
jgi:hypothetical protein